LNIGHAVGALNRALWGFVGGDMSKVSLAWIDKGKWLGPETIREIRQRTGAPVIHYTPDAQFLYNRSRLFARSVPQYDLVVTTKRFEIELYHQHGAKRVHFDQQGFDRRFPPRLPTEDEREMFTSDVAFFGRCEPHYVNLLGTVINTGAQLKIWGPNWPRFARQNAWIRPHVRGEGVFGEQYPVALSCARIAIGALSKYIPETVTTRSFEIPASGAMLLAERTRDHLDLYKEGEEAEYFGSLPELAEKVRYYLANEPIRARIALAGFRRAHHSGYDSGSVLKRIFGHIEELSG
jgi:spore maturation protein CgeB